MSLRLVTLASFVAATALASGCVVEPVHERRPVVVERHVVQREYVEVVAPRSPPPIIVEQVAPRPGYIWARSYWRWDGYNYVAERGHWEPVRRGYHYSHPHWEQRGDGWHWRAGIWVSG